MCLFVQGGRHYLFACYSYGSLFAWAGMLYCDCVYLSMWAAEYVARRELVKAGRKSLKQQRWSEQLSGLADRRVDEQ